MKKALLIIFSVMLCMVLVFSGCKDETDNPGSIVDNTEDAASAVVQQNDGKNDVKSDNKILEGESVTESNLGKGVELFMSGNYYLEGMLYSSGEAMNISLATDGTNIQLTAAKQNITFGVLVLDGITYAVQPVSQKYTELTDALLSAFNIDSMSVSEFQNLQDDTNDDAGKVEQMAVTINGNPGLCTEFIYDETAIKLYSIGDDLIQVDSFDENGDISMQIVIDTITADIPSDQLTLKGLSKASISEFIASFITE